MKKIYIIFIVIFIFMNFCAKQKGFTDKESLLGLMYLLELLDGNIRFERKDHFEVGRNVARNYVGQSVYGDGNADGYVDNFLTPTGIYFCVRELLGWRSPEAGGPPEGQENYWNADQKVLLVDRELACTLINVKRNFDRYRLSRGFKGLNSSYDRIGFINFGIKYLFSPRQVADLQLRVVNIAYLDIVVDYNIRSFLESKPYTPEEIESVLDKPCIMAPDLTNYEYLVENAGLVTAYTNVEVSEKCNTMIENGFLVEYYKEGANGWYDCFRGFERTLLTYIQTEPFIRPQCPEFWDPYLSRQCDGGGVYMWERGMSNNYVKAKKFFETMTGEENPNIREYIKNKNGLIILKVGEEYRKRLDDPNAVVVIEIDAANVFMWDSETPKTRFDHTVDRPNPAIGKDLNIYLPRFRVRVE